MARARSGGGAAFAAALVTVSILFFVSMILAIVFYTQVARGRQDAATARDELSTYVLTTEKNRPEVVALKNTREGSIVGQLMANVQGLTQLINGNVITTREQIDKELSALDLGGQPLITEIKRLLAEQDASADQIAAMKQDLTTTTNRVQQLQQQSAQVEQTYRAAADDLKTQLGAHQSQSTAYGQEVDKQRQTLESRIRQLQQERQNQVNQLTSQIEQRAEQINVLKRKLAELQREGLNPESRGVNPATQPDGRVVSIIEEENLVYIDIGRVEHVLLGLTFEIFDSRLGVYLDESEKMRGKATIEVVNIAERSSVCRIVRQEQGNTVNKGDLIANVVYDPDVKYKFLVFGDFDIDNTGSTSLSDGKRVETMIERWGGRLATELTYDVDFLVLGLEPLAPTPLSRDEVDPLRIQEQAAQQERYDQHQRLIAKARALSISILNQNRFLALVGYYRR